ncbi:MAG: PspC domain-containing protein [Burkholderiaceae bacterium]|uniref:PspC domain-containing protein n=1 Tax=Rubrivivax albus TaxID=2499835 RepID=A0A437K1D0_9BURK|nr:PspC domain-containing protein [Rubrivivax albus]MCP5272233.1 PspC domain-containing protein [Burkholderiaceae bacterium]RVT54159.1 PspC domain-containing protein [Rubrivivax albus]
MGIADDLERLQALRAAGTLNDSEFERAKARVLQGDPPVPAFNKLRRSRSDRWLGGVCGGVAVLTGVDTWIWRLLVTGLALFGGTGILLYILLWIFVPDEGATN